MRRLLRGLGIASVLGVLALTSVRAASKSEIGRLSWLAGCWECSYSSRQYEEQWMRPRGGTMLGMSRTVAGDTTRQYEHVMIREERGGLVYVAKPSGQREASFRATEVTDSSVVFANPEHDFPQRIIYRLKADGSLLARVEGAQAGKTRGSDFPMTRTECP